MNIKEAEKRIKIRQKEIDHLTLRIAESKKRLNDIIKKLQENDIKSE